MTVAVSYLIGNRTIGCRLAKQSRGVSGQFWVMEGTCGGAKRPPDTETTRGPALRAL
jgi:hypothetical protein